MSLIPLDEQRGDGQPPHHDEGTDSTLVGRFLSSVSATLRSLFGADESDTAAEGSDADRSTADGDTGTETRAPAALPARADSGDVELVTTETEERLTVAVADNPDATISSDTWEPVER